MTPFRFTSHPAPAPAKFLGCLLLVGALSACTGGISTPRSPAVDGTATLPGSDAATVLYGSALQLRLLTESFRQVLASLPASHPAIPYLQSAVTQLSDTSSIVGLFVWYPFHSPQSGEPGDTEAQIATLDVGDGSGNFYTAVVNNQLTQAKFALYIDCCFTREPFLVDAINFKSIEGTLGKDRRSGSLQHFVRVDGRTGPADKSWTWVYAPGGVSTFSLDNLIPDPQVKPPQHTDLQLAADGTGQGTVVQADGSKSAFTWP